MTARKAARDNRVLMLHLAKLKVLWENQTTPNT